MLKRTLFIVSLLVAMPVSTSFAVPRLKLPFPGGETWQMTRGYNTPPTHRDYGSDWQDERFALDFVESGCRSWGKPVLAAADGIIEVQSARNNNGYGINLMVNHGDRCKTRYAHLNSISVPNGAYVRQGQEVGRIGNTGNVEGRTCPQHPGMHIHFALYCSGDGQRPEPMSGYRNFTAGRSYRSDNYIPFLVTPDGNNPHVCGDLPRGGEGTNQHTYTCQDQRDVFEEGDTVWGLFRINNVRATHTFLARLCDGDFCPEERRWTNQVPAGQMWGTAFNWPEFRNVEPGEWEIRWFVDVGAGFRNQPDGVASFSVLADEEVELAGAPGEGEGQGEGGEPPPPPPPPPPPAGGYLYDGNSVTCLGPITGGDEAHGWVYTCEGQTDRFNQNQTAWGLVRLDEVYVPFQFRTHTYWFDTYNAEWDLMWPAWVGERYTPDAVWGWRHASYYGNVQNPPPGRWQTRVSLDTGNGFQQLTVFDFTSTLAGAPYEYRGIYTLCHGPIEAGNAGNNWRTTCLNRDMAAVHPVGTTIYGMLEINNIWVRHRMRITITQNGNPWDPWIGDWQHTDTPWMWAAIFPYTGLERMGAGSYTYFFDIDVGNGFVPVDNLSFTVR